MWKKKLEPIVVNECVQAMYVVGLAVFIETAETTYRADVTQFSFIRTFSVTGLAGVHYQKNTDEWSEQTLVHFVLKDGSVHTFDSSSGEIIKK